MAVRAFAYARHAGENAPNQQAIALYASNHSIEVVSFVSDPPGTDLLAKGMNFAQVLVQLHAGEADTIIVEELSCFSPDKIEQEIILGHLKTWGIKVLCLDDADLSSDDPERRLLRDFSSRGDLTKRIEGLRLAGRRIAARKRIDRRREGARPYGELAGEDRVLERIRTLEAQGVGHSAIANRLNEEGIPTRRGKRWHPTTIANILGARRDAAKRKAKRKSP